MFLPLLFWKTVTNRPPPVCRASLAPPLSHPWEHWLPRHPNTEAEKVRTRWFLNSRGVAGEWTVATKWSKNTVFYSVFWPPRFLKGLRTSSAWGIWMSGAVCPTVDPLAGPSLIFWSSSEEIYYLWIICMWQNLIIISISIVVIVCI